MKLFKKISLKFWIILSFFLLITLFSYFRIFNNFELFFYDLRLKTRPAIKTSEEILIIEVSDDTLLNLGEWPLPRDFHASLIKVLKKYGARLIVFDILFSETRLGDEIFSEAIKEAGNIYLPEAFYVEEKAKKIPLFPESNMLLGKISNRLEAGLAGKGHINVLIDADGKVRRVPLFIEYQNQLTPHLALRAACGWLGLNIKNLKIKKDKVIIDNDLIIPNSPRTCFLVNYPDKWQGSFRHLSYFGLLKAYNDTTKGIKPGIDLSVIKGKACFIGLSATGTSDLKPTPLEKIYPMLGLQASVFNSVIEKKFIKDAAPAANILISVIIFALSIVICLRFSALRALFLNIGLALSYLFISTGIFVFYGLSIDQFFPLLIIGLTYGGAAVCRFLETARQRQLLEKELEIAYTIQKSFLPQELKEFPGLEISSFTQPAKSVAGDFYDIFTIDQTKLGVFIGDVSGKGVPASLIMAQIVSLFRIFSRQYTNCSELIARLNKELCGKFKARFVTCLYMIIDIEKHKIRACSAGHEPLLIYKDKQNKIYHAQLSAELPLGIMEGVDYKEIEINIEKGDKFVLFTDGLSEARNKEGEEFGIDKIKEIISTDGGSNSKKTITSLKNELFEFSRALPQGDDITLVVISVEK